MVTFAEGAANRDTRWIVILEIEGIGDVTGLIDRRWRFCSRLPAYYEDHGTQYKDWLTEWPEVLSERADLLGGIPESGAIDFSILDYDDALTERLQLDGDAVATLDGDIDNATNTITVLESSVLSVDTSYHVGNEALFILATPTSTTATATRARLGTEAQPHKDRAQIFTHLTYLRSRRVDVYLVPFDADSALEERLFGSYHIDTMSISDDANTYRFSARSQLKYLDRLVPRKLASFTVASDMTDGRTVGLTATQDYYGFIEEDLWPTEDAWILLGDSEIARVVNSSWEPSGIAYELVRGQLGTRVGDWKRGDAVQQILVADPNGPSSFKWSPSPTPSTSRSFAPWVNSAHWIDILLNILLSSYSREDGFELNNRNDAYGAWDSLPVGYGVGIPHSKIDFDSFREVQDRTSGYLFPNFYFGHKTQSFGDLISENFLRPIGAFLTIVDNKLSIVLPRRPLADDVLTAVGVDEILTRVTGRGVEEQIFSAQHDLEYVISSVVYKTKAPDGSEVQIIMNSADYFSTIGQRGYYAHDAKSIEIDLPGARADAGGFLPMAEDMTMRRLRRFAKPNWRAKTEVDMSLHDVEPGSVVAITNASMPNFAAGTRGWTAVPAVVLERRIRIEEESGARIELNMITYSGNERMGRICPSGSVASFSGPVTGNYTLTLRANVYTQSDVSSPHPTTDAAAFAAGDVLELWTLEGTKVGTTQTVLSRSGNDLVVDGNWGGGLANDLAIVYANRDQQVAAQYNAFVSYANETDPRTVGASAQTPWKWAET